MLNLYWKSRDHTRNLIPKPYKSETEFETYIFKNQDLLGDVIILYRQIHTGSKQGLRDWELIWVESETGRKVKGRVKLTQAIHPEGLGIAACAGHWGDGMPVAKGKGVFFNELLELDWKHASPVNLNLDLCVRVKVSPVEARS